MRSCLRDCSYVLKNPVVLIFLFMFGFIQIIIFLATVYDNPSSSRSQTNSRPVTKTQKKSFQLDYQFNTVFKVVVINSPQSQSSSSSLLKQQQQQQQEKQLLSSSSSSATKKPEKIKQKLNASEFIHYGSEDFQYPLLVDMPDVVQKVKKGLPISITPVNEPNFRWMILNENKCHEHSTSNGVGGTGGGVGSSSGGGGDGGTGTAHTDTTNNDNNNNNNNRIDLLILIKSAPGNAAARHTIRQTWAKETCWGGRNVKRIFLFGNPGADQMSLQQTIVNEQRLYGDVIQQNFIDNYNNNTYKMMLGFTWATTYCDNARDILFVDDDYFVQPRAVAGFLDSMSEALRERLVAGHVWRLAQPVRNKRGPLKKWYIELREYPWSTYPSYIGAGAFFVSMHVAKDVVIATKYTRYLRFDDVFLGLVLHKLAMAPIHLAHVQSFEKLDPQSPSFKYVLANHGYRQSHDILKAWFELKCEDFCIAE